MTGSIAVALAVLLAAFVTYVVVVAGEQEHRNQSTLYAEFRSQLAHGVAPVAGPIALGRPVALLTVPALGGRDVVVEGSASRQLMRGPGHEPATPLPGQPGVSVVLGRRSTFGSPFAHLDRLSVGDEIVVTTGQGRFTYRVDSMWRSDRAHQSPPPALARLTLVTGDPAYTPSRSIVVSAAIVGAPAPAGTLTAPQRSATPLSSDTGSTVPAYLWAQALFALALLATWLWRRIPHIVIWVGALPLGLLVLWNLFENLAALLPNTL